MMYYKIGCAYNDIAINKNMAISYLTKAVATAPRSEAGLLAQNKLAKLQQ